MMFPTHPQGSDRHFRGFLILTLHSFFASGIKEKSTKHPIRPLQQSVFFNTFLHSPSLYCVKLFVNKPLLLPLNKAIVEGRLQNNILCPVESLGTQLKETVTQQNSLLGSIEEASRESWEKFSSEFEQHQAECSTSHTSQMQALSDKLNSESAAQSQFRHTTIALNKQLQRNITSYQNQTSANLAELSEQVDRFHRDELTLYQPTGQTPVRKTVNYPRDVPMTSPHDRIIRRFWRERGRADLDLSTTISEVSVFQFSVFFFFSEQSV